MLAQKMLLGWMGSSLRLVERRGLVAITVGKGGNSNESNKQLPLEVVAASSE
jgi:hypothetical protein